MEELAVDIIKEKLRNGLLERSFGPYRNRWFMILKKNGKGRLIIDGQTFNKVTIRDAALPPMVDEFAEAFAGYPITSAIDLFAGYDQMPLAEVSRDLTAIQTPLGLMRSTRIPMGATNSVAQFQRVMCKILHSHIPHHAAAFLDDIGVKGPKTRYNNEEIRPNVRRFVMEHLEIVEQMLRDCIQAGITVSGEKSRWGLPGIEIVGFLCDESGRHPEHSKVQKIQDWPPCKSVTEIRAFVGLCVYYRIWIPNFAIIMLPLYQIIRKNSVFVWGPDQEAAMEEIKERLTSAPAIQTIDYKSTNPIILSVDASTTVGWGVALHQEDDEGKKHLCRCESGIWRGPELLYDAVRQEITGLARALKKLRFWLWGHTFVIEGDSLTMLHIINKPPVDLPNAAITRHVAYIRLFDFTVRHISGPKNVVADALSRRGQALEDPPEGNYDEFFDRMVGMLEVHTTQSRTLSSMERQTVNKGEQTGIITFKEDEYEDIFLDIGHWLSTLQRQSSWSDTHFKKIRRKAARFLLHDGLLYYRPNKNLPRRVLCRKDQKQQALQQLHDQFGHYGRDATFNNLRLRYYWVSMWEDVKDWVQSCQQCQFQSTKRYDEELHPTWVRAIWEKVGLDVTHIGPGEHSKKCLVVARDDLSGWVEARALKSISSEAVARFLYEEVITRFGCFKTLVTDGGPENKGVVETLASRYGIKINHISAYHPQSNGMVERGHAHLINALAKMSTNQNHWPHYLPAVLWADRITTKSTTGYSPYHLMFGTSCLLPIDMTMDSWHSLNWNAVLSTSDLLTLRAQQINWKESALTLATGNLSAKRLANKYHFDNQMSQRPNELSINDMILLHDTKLDKQWSGKLKPRWTGPYRIVAIGNNGSYKLSELDGTLMNGTYAGNRIKKFHTRSTGESAGDNAKESSQGT